MKIISWVYKLTAMEFSDEKIRKRINMEIHKKQ